MWQSIGACLDFIARLLNAARCRTAVAGRAAAADADVLLITLDTTRADRMGFLGSTRGLTPALDALARTGTVFTRAYAQAPITTVSHATILTGTYPPFHGVDDFGAPLPASVPYLPDLLRRGGYRTAAFVGSIVLDPRSGTAPGFDRGFAIYDAGFRLAQSGRGSLPDDRTARRRGGGARGALARRAAAIGVRAVLCLGAPLRSARSVRSARRSRSSGSPRRRTTAKSPPSIARSGRLVAAAGRDTLVIVAADHGEALGDHGETTHGVFLYEESLHVPLVIRFPQGQAAGVRVTTRVRLADIAPTVLESVGMPVPRGDARPDAAAAGGAGGDARRPPGLRGVCLSAACLRLEPARLLAIRSFSLREGAAPRVVRPGQRPGGGAQPRR